MIANGIPQTAEIDRQQARLEVTYDGEPQFRAISGSLDYSINTATPVIRCGDRYFACEDGVWFTSASPMGPWVVADSVPAAIYEIPPTCPIHYVTYCRIYDVDSDWICFGYTPGYFGCYVEDGCVVWGAGWWWTPWIDQCWYGCPWTYGFGVGVRWGHGWGWTVGLGFGATPFCAPWWGPLGRPHPAFYPLIAGHMFYNLNVRNADIYGAWPRTVVRVGEPYISRPASAAARPNNIYSGADGRVYRQTGKGWEQREGSSWRPSPTGLDGASRARDQGATRSIQRRQPSSLPRVYRPLAPQHQAPQQPAPRPAPQAIPPGLRGGVGGGWSGGGGGGHRGR